jgi:hypothetical protein
MDEPVFGVTFFSKELPAYDDIKPLDCAVRTEGSLLPPRTTDALENLHHYSHFLKMAKCQNREPQPMYSS